MDIIRGFCEKILSIVPLSSNYSHELERLREACRAQTAARERLEEALGVLQTALTHETPGISRVDASGSYLEVNDHCARLLGYAPGELIGKHWSTVFTPEDLNAAALAYGSLADGQTAFEARVVLRDGSSAHLRVGIINISGPADQPLGYYCLIGDLTDRKKTAAALRTAEFRFRLFAEQTRDVFWIASPTRRADYVSPAFVEIWGLPVEVLCRDPLAWKKPIHPDDQARVDTALQRQARGYAPTVEYRIVCPDGSVRWIRDRAFPTTDCAGEWVVFGIAEDITERKTQERDRVDYLIEQRHALMREVYHRIKNHLQAAVGLLGTHIAKSAEASTAIQGAQGQLLTLTAIYGLQGAGDEEVTLETLVPAVIQNIRHVTGVEIAFSSAREPSARTPITAEDCVPLALIVNELCFNAVKHGSAQSVSLTITKEGEDLGLCVVNRGCLPPGFDFADRKGLGTGLSLVASLLPPKGLALAFSQCEDRVVARLFIGSPVIKGT
ncbi:MAG: PAS domain S-box protein [Gammaproteobacteria bacterium]